jgi:hypothetical protein
MKRMLLAALVLAPAVAHAQWQMGLTFGVRARPDNGRTISGLQFEGMIVHPMQSFTGIASLAIVQMRNKTTAGNGFVENSIEANLLLRRKLAGIWCASFGPVLSYSTGCASSSDLHGTTYGAVACSASFVQKGTVRPGYLIQLDLEKTNARGVTWRAGLRGTGHTVASGSKTPKPVLWGGFTAPLSH